MTEAISAAEYRARMAEEAKPSKYNAKACWADGHRFASKKERDRYLQLRALEKAGEISHLELQPVFKFAINGRPVLKKSDRYPNGRQATYIADFAYFDGRHRVVEDVKGMKTEVYKLKKAIVEAMYPAVRIVEV